MGIQPIGAARNLGKEFRDFLLKTNMLALALAVVLGGAVNKVVGVIVSDVLGGFVQVFQRDSNGWGALNLPLGRITLKFGSLVNVLIEFVLIAGAVFLITKMFVRNAPPAPTKTCPACREGIHPEASRCKFCTAEQPAAPPAEPAKT